MYDPQLENTSQNTSIANISKSSLNIAVILSICLWATSLTIDI